MIYDLTDTDIGSTIEVDTSKVSPSTLQWSLLKGTQIKAGSI